MDEAGCKIGSYIIDGRLGRGGFASVYKASLPGTDQKYAIKILRQTLSEEEVGQNDQANNEMMKEWNIY